MYSLQLISGPDKEPVTLDEAKAHLRVEYDFTDDDALIESLIKTARQYTEDKTSNILNHQTWKLVLDTFPAGDEPVVIRKRPVTDINSITYVDADGASQTLTSYQFDQDSFLSRVRPAYSETWPTTREQLNAVEIRFSAGHENTAAGVPEPFKQAILLLVGHYYENREDSIRGLSIQTLPRGYEALAGINQVMKV